MSSLITPDYRILNGAEALQAMKFIEKAAEAAKDALCKRSKCGSAIVKDGQVIVTASNNPPLYDTRYCTCEDEYDTPLGFRYDRTCCIHAETEAMLKAHPANLKGATLYYAGLDKQGNFKPSKSPKCTTCSRLALHLGLAEFVLCHPDDICVYSTAYYNELSYRYSG